MTKNILEKDKWLVKKRIYQILEVADKDDMLSRIFDISIMILIFLNVIAVMLETIDSLSAQYSTLFKYFELVSVIIFTIEYLLRIITCTSAESYDNHPVKYRIRFACTAFALIDLAAILPFYLPMIITVDLRFIRAIRLFRLFRLFKLGRYSDSVQIFTDVIRNKKEELVITAAVGAILLVLASSLMYYVEHENQPEVFSSIPASMWWGVATLTTVGYGDVYPVTILGKMLGAVIAILGIGMFALPAGILGGGFVEAIEKKKKKLRKCPHCGEVIKDNK